MTKPPPRDALAESYENLDQAAAKRIAAQLLHGDAVRRVQVARRRLWLLGIAGFLLVGGVVAALLARTTRGSLGRLETAVESHRSLAPAADEDE